MLIKRILPAHASLSLGGKFIGTIWRHVPQNSEPRLVRSELGEINFRCARIELERDLTLFRQPGIVPHERPIAGVDSTFLLLESEMQWEPMRDAV